MDKIKFMKMLKYSLRFLPDESYIKLYYLVHLKKKINLKSPKTLNEKINWLKFNDRDPFYSVVVDKFLNREYIESIIGEEYLVPLIGVWEKFEDIDFSKIPKRFVLKCTHDSGGLVICHDKSKLNINKIRKKINDSLKCNFFYVGREWQYKNIKPRIICEEFLGNGQVPPDDYKLMCFNGKVDNVMVCSGRETGNPQYYFFDLDWKLKKYNKSTQDLSDDFQIPKPLNFERMVEIAEKLAKPYYFARVDLYNIEGKIYFGEITLTPNSGFDANLTTEADIVLGEKLLIPGLRC